MDKSARFWNKMSMNYDNSIQKKYKTTYEETTRLTRKYITKDAIVLDFACGTGIVDVEIAKDVNKILAVDISDKMIENAKLKTKNAGISNLDFMVTDIYDSRLIEGSFNVVMAFNIIQFCKEEKILFERIWKLLAPDGMFISTTDCYGEKKSVMNLMLKILIKLKILPYVKSYSCSDLEKAIINNGFDILETKTLYINPLNYFIAAGKGKDILL